MIVHDRGLRVGLTCLVLLMTAQPCVATTGIVVSTVAGDGSFGVTDGPALSASFMEPDGIAAAADGSVYVADGGAQQIRRIHGGMVELVAGNAPPGRTSQARAGGFADGPTETARFYRPTGIVVAKDGALYVADSLNRCIRRIAGRTVSTFAGSRTPGKADGRGIAAQFNLPKSIAIDDDDNLYVADYGNGIRKITPDGSVTTLNLPSTSGKVLAVSARGKGRSLLLAYTDPSSIHLITPSRQPSETAGNSAEPYQEGFVVGYGYGITILGPDAVVVTDLLRNSVKFVRFGGSTGAIVRALAGGINDSTRIVGGFKDGPSDAALVHAPLGITALRDGSLLVADSGNRRIRKIVGLDARGPVILGEEQGLVGPKTAYRVAVVGNSYVFHDVLWPESIPGKLEAGLLRGGNAYGLSKKPYLTVARINSAGPSVLRDYVRNYLGDGEADLVILVVNSIANDYELGLNPSMKQDARWKIAVPQIFNELQTSLASKGTKFMVVYLPMARSVNELEQAKYSVELNGLEGPEGDYLPTREVDQGVESIYMSSKAHSLSLLAPMEKADLSRNRIALYNTRDEHLSPAGQAWVGTQILQELERWRPWAR